MAMDLLAAAMFYLSIVQLLLAAGVVHCFTPSDVSSHFTNNPTSFAKVSSRAAPTIEPEVFPGPLPFLASKKRTACESAVLVEWERMTELDRRIEDGFRYEHDPDLYQPSFMGSERQSSSRRGGTSTASQKHGGVDALPSHRAVFCGYRITSEEYGRLRSASPTEDLM
jgi:hypothetical protein